MPYPALADIPFLGETLALLTGLVWSSAVILFKKSGESMSPLGLNLFKNVVALLPTLLTLFLIGDLVRPELLSRAALLLFLSGVLGVGIGDSLFLASLHALGASRSALVSCLYSPCIIVLSFLFLGEALSLYDFVGGVLILSSILLTSVRRRGMRSISRAQLWLGIGYGAAAVTAMGLSIVMVKSHLEAQPLVWAATVRLVGGTLALMLVCLCLPQRREIWQVFRPQRVWRVAIPATLLGSYLAMFCWIGGFKYADASIAALLNQTSTVFTVLLAAIFLREGLTWLTCLALILAAGGSVLVILL